MKKIQLSKYNLPKETSPYINDKLYSVYLGNQRFIYAPSKRKILKSLARTNIMLNEQLYFLSKLHVQLYAEYREFWFYSESYVHTELELAKKISLITLFSFAQHKKGVSKETPFVIYYMLLILQ